MNNRILKTIKRVLEYWFKPKQYMQGIEYCGQYSTNIPQYIINRVQPDIWRNKKIACFSVYLTPIVFRLNRCKYKFFFTAENTHAICSPWRQWEDCHLWKDAPDLSLGFDYYEHPKYLRFPYWLIICFRPNVVKDDVESFVEQYMYSDISNRSKDCAFVCRSDYYGDRALLADLVAQVMPMSYPSDFRHNDDDMRGKYKNNKLDYLRDFQFNLCPENTNNKGYVTEKIFEAIIAGCVPIYWGNEGHPEPDILNPKAIVYLDKDNPEEGLALLRKLYEDPKAYAEFAAQPRFLPGAADKMYAYYERLEERLKEVLER